MWRSAYKAGYPFWNYGGFGSYGNYYPWLYPYGYGGYFRLYQPYWNRYGFNPFYFNRRYFY